MSFSRTLTTGALGVAILASSTVPVLAKERIAERVSAPREYINPYQPALECLSRQLTEEQKRTVIGVLYFGDRTGKEAYAPDGASGKFLGQGAEDTLINALAKTGMMVTDISPASRQLMEWSLPKLLKGSETLIAVPDILVSGSFPTLDFGDGSVKEISVFGVGGGSRKYSLRYTMDMRATAGAGNRMGVPAGLVLADVSLEKDVVGREKKAGVAGFFGSLGSSSYIELNINTQKRELLQYSQRFMTSRAAYGIIADWGKITACQDLLEYGDRLISDDFPATPATKP